MVRESVFFFFFFQNKLLTSGNNKKKRNPRKIHLGIGMEKGVDCYFCSYMDIAGLLSSILPFTNVKKPF